VYETAKNPMVANKVDDLGLFKKVWVKKREAVNRAPSVPN